MVSSKLKDVENSPQTVAPVALLFDVLFATWRLHGDPNHISLAIKPPLKRANSYLTVNILKRELLIIFGLSLHENYKGTLSRPVYCALRIYEPYMENEIPP